MARYMLQVAFNTILLAFSQAGMGTCSDIFLFSTSIRKRSDPNGTWQNER